MRSLIKCFLIAASAVWLAASSAAQTVPFAAKWPFKQIFSDAPVAVHAVSITALFSYSSDATNIFIGSQTNRFLTDTNNELTVSNLFSGVAYRVTYDPISSAYYGKNPQTFTNYFGTNIVANSLVNGADPQYLNISAAMPVAVQLFMAKSNGFAQNPTFGGKVTLPAGTVGYVWTQTNADGSGEFRASSGGAGGGATNAYQSGVSGVGLSLTTNALDFTYTFALSAALQAWNGFTPQTFSNVMVGYFDAVGSGVSAATSATNAMGLSSGLSAFAPTNRWDVSGAGAVAATTATNGFPWGSLYDPAGAAHSATNGFPWGPLYDIAGAAVAATNGFPWGVLYDVAGAAQAATNGFPQSLGTGTANSSTFLNGAGQWATPPGSGGSATNVNFLNSPFATWSTTAGSNVVTVVGLQPASPNLTNYSNRATNTFDGAGAGTAAATAATNGFPWGSLYDPTGTANTVSNSLQVADPNVYFVRTNGADATAVVGFKNRSWKNFTNALAQLKIDAPDKGTIDLGVGTFLTDPTTNGSVIPSNVTIRGQGVSQTFLVPGNLSQATTNANGAIPMELVLSGDNIDLSGFTCGTNTANGNYYIPIALAQGTNQWIHSMTVIGDSDGIWGNGTFAWIMNTNCSGSIDDVRITTGFDAIVMNAVSRATNSTWRIQNTRINISGDTNFPSVQNRGIFLGHFTNTVQNCNITVNSPGATQVFGVYVSATGMTNYLTLANTIFSVNGTSPLWLNCSSTHAVTTIRGLLDPNQVAQNGSVINWDASDGSRLVNLNGTNIQSGSIPRSAADSSWASIVNAGLFSGGTSNILRFISNNVAGYPVFQPDKETSSGGGGNSTSFLMTSNCIVASTNIVLVDCNQVQEFQAMMLTNSYLRFTNAWALTNYHDMSLWLDTWEDTNGAWKFTGMDVVGGLLRTNGGNWRGTNANQYDSAAVRLDGTLTNLMLKWDTNILPSIKFTNSLSSPGGGGGGGGAFTLVAHTAQTNASGNTVTASIDTTGATLEVVLVAYNSGSSPTIASSLNASGWSTATNATANHLIIFYKDHPTAGTGEQVTISTVGGTTVGVMAFSKSGGATSALVGISSGTSTGNWNANLHAGSLTPGGANDLFISGQSFDVANSGNDVVDSSFTAPENTAFLSVTQNGLNMAYKAKSSDSSAENPGWTRPSPNGSDAYTVQLDFQ